MISDRRRAVQGVRARAREPGARALRLGAAAAIEPISYQADGSRIRLAFLGRYTMGFFGIGGAVPAAYDPPSRRLFVINADRGWIDAVDIADPAAPKLVAAPGRAGLWRLSPEHRDQPRHPRGGASRASSTPCPARSCSSTPRASGSATSSGSASSRCSCASRPDGRKLVVVNHGEANDSYTVDPEGSVSIIDLGIEDPGCRGAACAIRPRAVQLDFQAFNDQKAALLREGVRIYGPGASVAQDLEPEAVAIAPDGGTAWVSLQRNNAMAVIDLASQRIVRIFALATKDHGRPGAGLDGSSVDGAINIRPWPIEGLYMPDIFEAYEVAGETFLVTPNEGDPREFGCVRRGSAAAHADARSRGVSQRRRAAAGRQSRAAAGQRGRWRPRRRWRVRSDLLAMAAARSRSGPARASWCSTAATISSRSWPRRCRRASTAAAAASVRRAERRSRARARGARTRPDRRPRLRLHRARANRRGLRLRHHRSARAALSAVRQFPRFLGRSGAGV